MAEEILQREVLRLSQLSITSLQIIPAKREHMLSTKMQHGTWQAEKTGREQRYRAEGSQFLVGQ